MENNFGLKAKKIEELENGYLLTTDHATYYIPRNCSDTTNTVVYAHGAGGSNSDYWKPYLENNNVDAIIAIPKDRLSYNNMDETSAMLTEDLANIHAEVGISNDNMFTIGHSSGGKACVYFMTENIKNNPSLGPQTCVVIDPATASTRDAGFIRSLTDEQLRLIGENHSNIIGLEHSGNDVRNSLSNYRILGNAGANVIVLGMHNMGSYSYYGAHVGIAKYAFNQGILSYLAGDITLEEAFDRNVGVIYQYDSNTGDFKKVSIDDISGYVGSIIGSYSNFDTDGNYYSKVNFDNFNDAIKNINSLEAFKINDLDTVSNDEKIVVSSMNTLRTNLKNTALIGVSNVNIGCQSTTAVPTCAENFLYDYFAIVLNLSDKLSQETQKAVNISRKIDETDKDLGKAVESMKRVVYVPIYGGGGSTSATNSRNKTFTATPTSNMDSTSGTNHNVAPENLKPYSNASLKNKNISDRIYNITADDLNKLFKAWAARTGNYNSPLLGTGEAWIKACDEVNLDPLTMIAICGEETGRGGFKAMEWMSVKNFVGMRYIDPSGDGTGHGVFWAGSNDLFGSVDEALLQSAKRIKNFYGTRYGGNSIASLAHTGYTGRSDSKGYVEWNNHIADVWASIAKESLDIITGTNGGI